MQVQEIIEDVKGRAEKVSKEAQVRYEKVSKQAQDVIKTSRDTAKKAGDLVKKNAKKVADTNQTTAKGLIGNAKSSLSKAREAGIKEVAAKPAEFLPEGKDDVLKAYNVTVTTVTKTREDLAKLLKKSADQIKVTIEGKKPVAKKATTARKPAARKAPAKKTTTARKAPAKAATAS